ncbi:MAG: peptidoglycan-binding protein [Polyangiales bacterium]
MPVHTVSEGDCLSSIAERYGFFWETLWNHPQNAHIVRDRKDPNTLAVGDAVFIPEKRMKSYVRSTGARYTWKVKGVPAKFRVQLRWGDELRADEPYVLTIDGELHEGRTDGEGRIEVVIRPDARHGSLRVGEGVRETEYEIDLGAMPPVDMLAGALGRLRNLGFYSGELGEELDDDARGALLAFQRVYGLEETGQPDDATKSALRRLHDGV